ncbi:unnamed protein product, partial [Lymnaea stagnalis]
YNKKSHLCSSKCVLRVPKSREKMAAPRGRDDERKILQKNWEGGGFESSSDAATLYSSKYTSTNSTDTPTLDGGSSPSSSSSSGKSRHKNVNSRTSWGSADTCGSPHRRDTWGSPHHVKAAAKVNGLEPRPCSKILLWIFACFALSLVALMAVFVVWTLMSYHSTISGLEARIQRLEEANGDYRDRIELVVNRRVDELLAKVRERER